MRKIRLSTISGNVLYEGWHNHIGAALEFCLQKNIPLDEIDLSGKKICHANLDGVHLKGASFRGADLTGANMSEATFTACDFSHAILTDTCLCYTDLKGCNFRYTVMDRIDISMASLYSCAFEGFNTLSVPFATAFEMVGLTYIHQGISCPFSYPPALITSHEKYFAILDNHIICKEIPYTFEHKIYAKSIMTSHPSTIQSLVDLKKNLCNT